MVTDSEKTPVLAAVERVVVELRGLLALVTPGAASVAGTAETIAAVEAAGRLMDAARVCAAAPLTLDRQEAERLGYASATAAVATLAQVSERTARTRLAVAEGITPDLSISGAPLPPAHPRVARALVDGRLGVEAAALIARELDGSASRVPAEARAAAEAAMVDLACGLDPERRLPLPAASVELLTAEVRSIGAAIDPDGALPREERAALGRSVRVGRQDDDGLIPFSGRLLPEVGTLFLGLVEAWRRSPRFMGTTEEAVAEGADGRTPQQRRHDALAEVLTAAAAAKDAPQLNGNPVTVLVTVTADELGRDGRDSDPIGVMTGSQFPVSRAQVERFIDAGGYRRVTLDAAGAVTGISSPERCFTGKQTLAIAGRDGFRCSAPGCTTAHTALQVHHVIPWRSGGPTTSNGILLCYWHHRRVDDGPWRYRMVAGLPEVIGPGIPEWSRLRAPAARVA